MFFDGVYASPNCTNLNLLPQVKRLKPHQLFQGALLLSQVNNGAPISAPPTKQITLNQISSNIKSSPIFQTF